MSSPTTLTTATQLTTAQKINFAGKIPVVGSVVGIARMITGLAQTIIHSLEAIFLGARSLAKYGDLNDSEIPDATYDIKNGLKNIFRGMVELVPILGGAATYAWDRNHSVQSVQAQ